MRRVYSVFHSGILQIYLVGDSFCVSLKWVVLISTKQEAAHTQSASKHVFLCTISCTGYVVTTCISQMCHTYALILRMRVCHILVVRPSWRKVIGSKVKHCQSMRAN